MSGAGRKSGRGERTISPDEAELWRHATRSLDKVRAKPRVTSAPAVSDVAAARTQSPVPVAPAASEPWRVSRPKPPPPEAAKTRTRVPPLAEFDRRKARQIASGKVEVDARIDLHGLRQRDAHARLRAFLKQAHAGGCKTVLVITGKGGSESDFADERQRGVLRRNVPHWLEDADLRAIVLSYAQAGVRHGGAGALYVRLRRGPLFE
jgi:DNA-nicking Smr family endonuclease